MEATCEHRRGPSDRVARRPARARRRELSAGDDLAPARGRDARRRVPRAAVERAAHRRRARARSRWRRCRSARRDTRSGDRPRSSAARSSPTHPSHPPGAMTIAALGALATTWVGGWTMVKLRLLNARWARARRDGLEAGARGTVISLQLMGLTADLLRGGLLTLIAFADSFAARRRHDRALDDRRASLAQSRRRDGGERRGRRGVETLSRDGRRALVLRRRTRRRTRDPLREMTTAAQPSPPRPSRRRRSASSRFGLASRSSCACSRFRGRGTTRACSATASGFASSRRCGCSRRAFTAARFKAALARESALLQRASVSRVGRGGCARAR